MNDSNDLLPSSNSKYGAFLVHIFTSCGVLTGFLALRAIHLHQWEVAIAWLGAGLLIDGLDGTFARMFSVKEVLPEWDGKSIDFVIDFVNYAFVPAYFLYESDLLPESWRLAGTFAVLLVSALYYGKSGMVSDDAYFVGFPVLWNGAVLYLFFVWGFGPWVNLALVLIMCVLHFVPIKYIYPSRTGFMQGLNIGLTVLFFGLNAVIVWLYPEKQIWLAVLSTLTVAVMWGLGMYASWLQSKEEKKP